MELESSTASTNQNLLSVLPFVIQAACLQFFSFFISVNGRGTPSKLNNLLVRVAAVRNRSLAVVAAAFVDVVAAAEVVQRTEPNRNSDSSQPISHWDLS